jgi:hypothetical protein
MEQLFLNSGSFEGLRESGSLGRPLHTLYPQLRAIIESELGREAALLLAEPVVDAQRTLIDWYTQGTGKPVVLASLPEDQRQAVYKRLLDAYDKLEALADTYLGSNDAGRVQLGTALKTALVPPADANVFLVDGQPVLTFWGFVQDRDWGEPMDLARWRERCRRPVQARPVPAAIIDKPPDAVVEVPVLTPPDRPPEVIKPTPDPHSTQDRETTLRYFIVVGSTFFWSVLAASVLLLVLAVALYLLGIFPPPPSRLDGMAAAGPFPAGNAGEALNLARATEAELRARLNGLIVEFAERRLQCAACPQPVPPQTSTVGGSREPDSQMTGQTQAPPQQPTVDENREFDSRLAEQGAASGEITVTLIWNNKNDLDLIVACPSGKLLYYNHPSECGGTLDVDKNADKNNLTERPVENIYWPAGQAPAGTYKIAVKYYARKDDSVPPLTDFQVRLVKDGRESLFKGVVSPEDMKPVTEFTVER